MAFQGYRMGNKLKSVIRNGTVFFQVKGLFIVGDVFRNIVSRLNGNSPGFKLESQIRQGLFVVFIVSALEIQTRFIAVIVNIARMIFVVTIFAVNPVVGRKTVVDMNQIAAIAAPCAPVFKTSRTKNVIAVAVIFGYPVAVIHALISVPFGTTPAPPFIRIFKVDEVFRITVFFTVFAVG